MRPRGDPPQSDRDLTAISPPPAGAMAQWISELPDELLSVVVALQLANEPALGTSTSTNDAINEFYARAHKAARAHVPATPLVLYAIDAVFL